MMRRWTGSLLGVVLLAALACGPLSSLPGGSSAGTASSLWSDVPPFPGADEVDVELPLFVRLAVEAASKAIMSEAGDSAGKLEFIAYTTGQTAEEVMAYYTPQRMAAEGWTAGDQPGCGTASAADEQLGGMCVFAKEGDALNSGLFLVITPEDGTTSLFYIRIDANPEALATTESDY